jgi:hypothetical protein
MAPFVLAVLIAVIVAVGIVMATRRAPQTADQVLNAPVPRAQGTAKPLQGVGDLAQVPLTTVLGSLASNRATGALTVRRGADEFAIYFLFGHPFHATGPGIQGDEAVTAACRLSGGTYSFDGERQLPTAETITRPLPDLLS